MVGPHHASLGKCTSDAMVDIVMDLTDVVVYWVVGASVVTIWTPTIAFCSRCGAVDADLKEQRTLSSRKSIANVLWQLPSGHGLDDPLDSSPGPGLS